MFLVSELHQHHSGWIVDGPSRESLFDSLRLGFPISVCFFTKGKKINKEVFVTGIKKIKNRFSVGPNSDYKIELSIRLSHKKKEFWSGNYSTQTREGKITGGLPSSLIV